MAFKSVMFRGTAALFLAASVAGCQFFQPEDDSAELDSFRVKEGANKNKAKSTEIPFNPDDPNGPHGKGAVQEGPGSWTSNPMNPYDNFGTPIPGLTLPTVYFKFDQSRIDSSEMPKIDEIASYLMTHPGTGVVVEGNCDNRGSDEYNRALGERRALAAKDYLISKGIAESRIRTISYGEERPAAMGDDEGSRAKNRRDDFVGVTLRNR